jgi:hypothetical protein
MSDKETLFTIEDLDNPFERQKLESLPNYILVELLIRHLKREIKTIEYLKTFHFIDNIRVLDIKEYEKLLEILGDKEQEEYTLTKDENGTTQINGEWYRVDKK